MNDSLPAVSGANVIFIDSRVKDPQSLLEGVAPDTQVVFLDGAADGLAQMAAYLAGHPAAGSVHVVAHGSAGDLWLGSSYLDAAALQAQAGLLGNIGASLAPDGDILLYSCNLGAGEAGAAFIASLAALTGADVAASDDRTGAGGDWQLEITHGEVTASVPFTDQALDAYGRSLLIHTVTSNADSGANTLRQLIADATSGDTITFNAAMTVSLTSATAGNMLAIGKNLTIDGDLNNDGAPDVTLDAQNKGRVLEVTSGTLTLDGLVITNGLAYGNGGGFGGTTGGDALGAGLSVSGAGTKVTILHSTITGNAASGGGGGGSGDGSYSYGGGGGGGRNSVGGGNGGDYNGSTPGGTGLNGTGGIGGHNGTSAQAGKGGSTTGGAGGSIAGGFVMGGNGATAGSIGGGGGGAGASGGASGGRGGHTAGGIFVGSGATVYMASSTVSNNWGAGGGGGGGYASAGGAGGDGAGAVRVVGTFKYDNTSMTFSSNSGVGGSGGGSNGVVGANGNSTNNIRSAGGTVDPNWTPPNTAPTLGTVTTSNVTQANAGANSYTFTVAYSDSDGTIDNTTIDTNDVTVAKGGTNLTVSNASWNAGTNTATYTVTPDGGTWDDGDNGSWIIAVVANQVADDGGAFVSANASAGSFTVSMDTTGPTVSSVSSSSTNGSYKAGDTLTVTVQFNESVTVTGTPTLALNSGGTAAYASGSGTNTLTFSYTILAGENASDLDYAATNSLALSGGTIRDAASNNAALTLPAVGGGSSLGGQKNIVIDTTAPPVSSVSASTSNGTYKVGDTIAVTVTFAETVMVTGTPTLTLNSGGTASYASGSGSNTLTFNYTVGAGDSAADLDYAATNSLALSGGTIKDVAGNNATLTLPTVGGGSSLGGQKNIVIDGVAPTLSSNTVPSNGTYTTGQNLDFTVTYSEAVTVNTGGGTPYIALTLDTGGSVQAAYLSGSGTTTLTFRYTVASGNVDADGVAAAGSITLNGGTLRDAAGNNAATTGISFASTASVLVEAVAPTVSSINRVSSATTNATSVDYTVTFAENVSGVDTSDFTLTTTGTAAGAIASVAQVDGSTYTVTVNTITGNGTLRLDLKNAGTGIADTPGNAITSGYTAGQTYTIDNTAPAVNSVGVPASATYISGQNLDFTVNFGENVTVNTGGGTPRIALTLDTGGTVHASYLSGSGTTALVFRHTIASGTADANGITVGASVDANGGTLRDSAGNDATLTLNSVGSTAAVLVDAVGPTASIVVADTALAAGESALVTITFSEAVTGFTNADLTIANGTLGAVSSGDGGITWTATLTPSASITDATNLVTLDNTGVTDAVGNAGSGSTDSNNYAIDTQRPTATVVVADTSLIGAETSAVTITFSEAVTGFGNADLTVANGTLGAVSTGDGGITWTATLTPHASVLDTSNVITLDMTGVADAAGNAGSGTTDSNNYAIDTTDLIAPVFASATVDGSTLVLTYTEANNLDAVNVAAAGAFAVTRGGSAVTVNAVAVDAAAKTVTLTLASPVAYGQAVTVAYTDPTGGNDANATQDAGGNDAASLAATPVTNNTIDPTPLTATLALSDTTLKAGETALLTISFSEAVSGLDLGDFGVPNGSLGALGTLDNTTWTTTYTPAADITDASNTIGLGLAGVLDIEGIPGNGTPASANFTIDTLRPGATLALSSTTLKTGETAVLTISFSEAVTGLDAGDLRTSDGGLVSAPATTDNIVWTAVYTPPVDRQVDGASIELVQGGVVDAAGNAGLGSAAVTGITIDTKLPDTSAPSLVSASINGAVLSLVYADSDALDTMRPPAASAFSVMVAGVPVAVSGVTVSAGGVSLALAQPAQAGQAVSVSYADPTAGNDASAIQDASGNDAASFSNIGASNSTPPLLGATLSLDDTLLAAGETATVSISFNEPVSGFDLGDMAAANAGLANLASSDNVHWTATLTPTPGANGFSNVITLNLGGISTAAGTAGSGSVASPPYAVDTLAPVFDAAGSSPAAGATGVAVNLPLVLQFSEPLSPSSNLSGVTLRSAGNDAIVPASVAVDANGRLVVTPQAALAHDSAYTLAWPADALRDAAGNRAAAVGGHAFHTALNPATEVDSNVIDGADVETRTTPEPDGGTTTVIEIDPIAPTRQDDPTSENPTLADIPLAPAPGGGEPPLLSLSLPPGVGVQAEGRSGGTATLREQLVQASSERIGDQAALNQVISTGIDAFMPTVDDETAVTLRVIDLRGSTQQLPGGAPIVITGALGRGEGSAQHPDRQEVLVIDSRNLPANTVLQLDNVEFSVVIGAATLIGGNGSNRVVGDSAAQTFALGIDDDLLRGGGGDDTVASKEGNDQLHGDEGDDLVVGGVGNDTLEGGQGHDVLQGGASDAGRWTIQLGPDGVLHSRYAVQDARLTDVPTFDVSGPWGPPGDMGLGDERVQFSFQATDKLATVALLHQAVLDRLPTLAELNHYVALPATTQQLAQFAFDAFRLRQDGFDTSPLAIQVRALAEAVWGAGPATEALLGPGAQFITGGGSWADALLYLVNDPRGRAAITDSQGQLNLAQPYVSGEIGWGADTGADVLRGGDGDDRLVGGRGNDLLDGGAGTDRVVFVGRPEDHTIRSTVVNGGQAFVVTGRYGGDEDTLIGIEQWEIGAKLYAPAAAMANLVAGQEYELADLLVELTGVAPG